MQKARQSLLQIGTFILCFNGVWWFISNMREGPTTFGQLMFRLAVFLLGLALVVTGGLLALIERLQRRSHTESSGPQVIEESDLIDGDAGDMQKEIE